MARPDGSLPTPPPKPINDPFYALRRRADLPRARRATLERRRDELDAALAEAERVLVEWFRHHSALLDEALQLHEELWPRVAGNPRRPPKPDRRWLPALPNPTRRICGAGLRIACQGFLRRHGTLTLEQLHALLHIHGYEVDSPNPVKALAEAMGYETRQNRCDRVERGTYRTKLSGPPPGRPVDPPLVTEPFGPDDIGPEGPDASDADLDPRIALGQVPRRQPGASGTNATDEGPPPRASVVETAAGTAGATEAWQLAWKTAPAGSEGLQQRRTERPQRPVDRERRHQHHGEAGEGRQHVHREQAEREAQSDDAAEHTPAQAPGRVLLEPTPRHRLGELGVVLVELLLDLLQDPLFFLGERHSPEPLRHAAVRASSHTVCISSTRRQEALKIKGLGSHPDPIAVHPAVAAPTVTGRPRHAPG